MSEIVPIESGAGFDYDALDAVTAERVRSSAEQIRSSAKCIGSLIIAIGVGLNEVKGLLDHGQWLNWLDVEVNLSERTAQRYMQSAVLEAKSDTVSLLPPTTLYAITAKSTPVPVRDAIVERLEAGERLGDDDIRDLIANGKRAAKLDRYEAKLPVDKRKRLQAKRVREQRGRERAREEWSAREARQAEAKASIIELLQERLGKNMLDFLDLLETARYLGPSDFSGGGGRTVRVSDE